VSSDLANERVNFVASLNKQSAVIQKGADEGTANPFKAVKHGIHSVTAQDVFFLVTF
jgi:hypothetical protein